MEKSVYRSTKFEKILKPLSSMCFIFIVIFAIWGVIVSPQLDIFYESAKIYEGKWIKTDSDGTQRAYVMPMSLYLNDEDEVAFTTMLPAVIEDGMYLSINTGKSFKMYIEGKEIYQFDNTISRLPGNITKTVIVPVPLKEEYASRELTMVISNGKYDRITVNTAYIGSLMGIVLLLIKNYAVQFLLAIILVMASIITIAIFAAIEKRENRKAPLIYLAEGMLAICLWVIADSPLFQLAFKVYFIDGIIGFMLVITMGYPFLMYFDAILEYRKHRIFTIFETIIVVNFIVLTLLHLTGIRSYDQALVYIDLMLVAYIGVMITCTLKDYFSRKDGKHRNVVIGLIGLSVFSVFEIVVTILSSVMPFKVDIGGLFVLAGMFILLFFAILDQVRVFEAINQETQNAIAATKAKSDFLANMSHEIRTPINAIMGMNEMILRESDQDSVKDYAEDINSASVNLLEIVNDILDFSKIESGKLEIVCDDYDLGELICDVTTLVNMKAENKGLKLNVSVDRQLPSKLHGDDKRIREIITNILNNAVKYTDEGFVNLKITGDKEDNIVTLCISVEDSGQGIKKEDLDKIYNGFSQVNEKKNRKVEGSGLGLTITKRLVELMNGSISVESEFGIGSTFTVRLPQVIVSGEEMGDYMLHKHASADVTKTQKQEYNVPAVKVLVVDDTALNLKVISKFLEKTDAILTCASSGEEMLKLIQENRYDVIFLDHMMPNMDGVEALNLSKKLDNNMCSNVPVIALTANAIVGAKEMYLEAGFNDYLSKPVKMGDLCEMIVKYTSER